MPDNKDLERAMRNAASHYESIKEMVARFKAACESDNDEEQDAARDAILEDPLSVEIRDGWRMPGAKGEAEEYSILLSTGGPACRIYGRLGMGDEPATATLQVQDWFVPWADWRSDNLEEPVEDTLLEYARQFYFSE